MILIPLKTREQRQFYAQQAVRVQLGVRGLRKQITQKAYQRTTIANVQLPDRTHYLSDNFKYPYLFDFLNLSAGYLELDLESAILQQREKFILEVYVKLYINSLNRSNRTFLCIILGREFQCYKDVDLLCADSTIINDGDQEESSN